MTDISSERRRRREIIPIQRKVVEVTGADVLEDAQVDPQ